MYRKRHKKLKKILVGVAVLTVLAIGLYAFALAGNGEGEQALANTVSEENSGRPRLRAAESSDTAPEGAPPFTDQVHINDIVDTQYLKLVNRAHGIAAPVNNAQLVTVWPDIPARVNYVTLHETAFSAMRELFAAAGAAQIGNLFIASGYRSNDEQSDLYTNAADRSYVMPPGHSEHQLGLAADILSTYNTSGMRGSEEARWLAENAPQFGLILRYPYGKQDITGVPYEPWHFRYVGRVHAWYMGEHNFVLEEYIAYLQETGGYQTGFAGRTYYVLYQQPEDGMIFVPEGLSFLVSSANTGGYIVTAWESASAMAGEPAEAVLQVIAEPMRYEGAAADFSEVEPLRLSASDSASAATVIQPAYIAWYKRLFNRYNRVDDSFSPPALHTLRGSHVSIDSRIYDPLTWMMESARAAGATIWAQSGYRPYSTQRQLFENRVNTYMGRGYDREQAEQNTALWIARPGTSEHQSGLAIDFNCITTAFENTAAFRWLVDNAHRYGFILRYPPDTTHITGVNYEPWHFRYVGGYHASRIWEYGVTLEEYVKWYL